MLEDFEGLGFCGLGLGVWIAVFFWREREKDGLDLYTKVFEN